jgi:hypothetical protein
LWANLLIELHKIFFSLCWRAGALMYKLYWSLCWCSELASQSVNQPFLMRSAKHGQ